MATTEEEEERLQEAPPILVVVTNASSSGSSLHQHLPGASACRGDHGDEEEDSEAAAATAAIFLGQDQPPLSNRVIADEENRRLIAMTMKKKNKENLRSMELQETADAATMSLSMADTSATTNGRPPDEAAIAVEAGGVADTASSSHRHHRRSQCWWLPGGGGSRVKFCLRETPAMSDSHRVRFLGRFRFGDTYKLKTRRWLVPQFLSGALTLTGVVLTLVGIISLQINKYLHACDAQDGVDCKSNKASINNVMMPIGVGSTGGGLSLILISLFVFVHAFCIIYDDPDNEDNEVHDGVLHIPSSSARAALLGSATALSRLPNEAELARCQSYYDNLQDYVAPR